MKRKVFSGLLALALTTILSINLIRTANAKIDPVALCQTWCTWVYMENCVIRAGDEGGTYNITCYNREWF